MPGSLACACAANFFGGGNVRSSRANVSSAVDDLVSVAKRWPPLEGARPAPVERLEMCSVVLWQHEEPTKTIQIAVVGVARGGLRIGLGGELGNQAGGGGHRLSGQALDAGPGDRGGGRAGLSGRSGLGAARETQANSGHPPLDDQKVGRHLTEPPVVVRPLGEVNI